MNKTARKSYRIKFTGIVDVIGRNKAEALANFESLHIGEIPHYDIDWSRELDANEAADFGDDRADG